MVATLYSPEAVQLLGHLELVAAQHRRPAATATPGPSRGQPGAGAFADEIAFELGQGGEDMEHELAAGRGGVDRFLQTPEPHAAVG
jgi:hypothetical protein